MSRELTPEEKEMLKTIKEIKDLALKIKDKIPPEWNEKFIEVGGHETI
jgi:hypothetical protein